MCIMNLDELLKAAIKDLSKYLSKTVKPNEHLAFISYEQDMGKKAAKTVEPFYVRKKRYFER